MKKSDADVSREAWRLKAKQLEAEIRGGRHSVTAMLHTLSKLCSFATDEGDFLRAASKKLAKKLS